MIFKCVSFIVACLDTLPRTRLSRAHKTTYAERSWLPIIRASHHSKAYKMSASVFKPIHSSLSTLNFELPRIRGTIVNRGMRSMEKVRRVLFEPVDHAETEQFLRTELDQYAHNDCNKWEFDFKQERPCNPNNNKGRYAWKPVTPSKISLAPRKRQLQVEYDNSECYPTLPEKDLTMVDPVSSDELNTEIPKRQSKITDFMQSRKRAADLAFTKKVSGSSSPIPTKRASFSS